MFKFKASHSMEDIIGGLVIPRIWFDFTFDEVNHFIAKSENEI